MGRARKHRKTVELGDVNERVAAVTAGFGTCFAQVDLRASVYSLWNIHTDVINLTMTLHNLISSSLIRILKLPGWKQSWLNKAKKERILWFGFVFCFFRADDDAPACSQIFRWAFVATQKLSNTKGSCMPVWRSISENIHTRCVIMASLKNSSHCLHNDLLTSYNCSWIIC